VCAIGRVSAWQFIAQAVGCHAESGWRRPRVQSDFGHAAQQSGGLEAELFPTRKGCQGSGELLGHPTQRTRHKGSISAKSSRQQGVYRAGKCDSATTTPDISAIAIDGRAAALEPDIGVGRSPNLFEQAIPGGTRYYRSQDQPSRRRRFAKAVGTPRTVPFWQLASYIRLAENGGLAAAGYRLKFTSFWHSH